MNILITILLILAGIIVLLLIIALFIKKQHYVKRAIIINAPRQKVFDYLKLLKNQDYFNKNAMADADRKKEYRGTDGTAGFTVTWSGNKSAGEGEKEIKRIVDGRSIKSEIRFVKPMRATAAIVMETEALSDDQTKASWSNAGALKYPINIFIPAMERSVAKDMDSSLATLKNILEKQTA